MMLQPQFSCRVAWHSISPFQIWTLGNIQRFRSGYLSHLLACIWMYLQHQWKCGKKANMRASRKVYEATSYSYSWWFHSGKKAAAFRIWVQQRHEGAKWKDKRPSVKILSYFAEIICSFNAIFGCPAGRITHRRHAHLLSVNSLYSIHKRGSPR